jgi:hypothetical protein
MFGLYGSTSHVWTNKWRQSVRSDKKMHNVQRETNWNFLGEIIIQTKFNSQGLFSLPDFASSSQQRSCSIGLWVVVPGGEGISAMKNSQRGCPVGTCTPPPTLKVHTCQVTEWLAFIVVFTASRMCNSITGIDLCWLNIKSSIQNKMSNEWMYLSHANHDFQCESKGSLCWYS